MNDYAKLAHYRRTVAESYARVRASADAVQAATGFRQERDQLFATHPLSPIPPEARVSYPGVPWMPYDPAWRIVASLHYDIPQTTYELELPEGMFRYQSFARAEFTTLTGHVASLIVYWILGYGGGVFLPFGDATNKTTTYGGGRYLYDTIKGADLGITAETMLLDFNYAYHPSCRYSPLWTCPLAPLENRLPFPIPAGEILEYSEVP
jgi:hypothetical protein